MLKHLFDALLRFCTALQVFVRSDFLCYGEALFVRKAVRDDGGDKVEKGVVSMNEVEFQCQSKVSSCTARTTVFQFQVKYAIVSVPNERTAKRNSVTK